MPPSAPMTEEKMGIDDLLSLMDGKLLGQVKITGGSDRGIITIQDDVLFESEGKSLKASFHPVLNKMCEIMKRSSYEVEIVGYTDSRPAVEKGYGSNWELSALKAVQVLKYFINEGGMPPERLSAYGYGDQKPLVKDETIYSRARNRRVDIILNFNMPVYMKRIIKKKGPGTFTYKKFDFKIF